MKKITISDVAEKAGVSKSTVSQFLNKRYNYMSEDTKQKIDEAIEELGYQPNIIARSLKQKRTSTIGVIVANILHTFSTQVIRAIEDVCHDNDIHLIVCNADDNPEKEKNYINMLQAKQVDGLIIFPTGGNVDLYQSMVKDNYPMVFVDRWVEEIEVDTVLLENENASYSAVTSLIAKGYENIGIITPPIQPYITPRIERIRGYKKALLDHKMPIEEKYIKSVATNAVQSSLEEMLSLDHPPKAVIAGNDLTLMEMLYYIKEKGIKIPDELGIIGIDEVPFANIFEPPLTTISQPAFEIGKKAARLLLDRIESPNIERKRSVYRFKPTLNIRESC